MWGKNGGVSGENVPFLEKSEERWGGGNIFIKNMERARARTRKREGGGIEIRKNISIKKMERAREPERGRGGEGGALKYACSRAVGPALGSESMRTHERPK